MARKTIVPYVPKCSHFWMTKHDVALKVTYKFKKAVHKRLFQLQLEHRVPLCPTWEGTKRSFPTPVTVTHSIYRVTVESIYRIPVKTAAAKTARKHPGVIDGFEHFPCCARYSVLLAAVRCPGLVDQRVRYVDRKKTNLQRPASNFLQMGRVVFVFWGPPDNLDNR